MPYAITEPVSVSFAGYVVGLKGIRDHAGIIFAEVGQVQTLAIKPCVYGFIQPDIQIGLTQYGDFFLSVT
jgi:hypothetical protein